MNPPIRLFVLLALFAPGLALADGERVIINEQTDECTLFRTLNGEAVPDRCKDDSKSIIKITPQPGVLGSVNFHSNSARLTADSTVILAHVAKVMSDQVSAGQAYRVDGHTDVVGDFHYNLRLSNRRADSVRDFLLEQGVPPERISSQGFGSLRLADPQNPTSLANRRVEVVNLSQGQN